MYRILLAGLLMLPYWGWAQQTYEIIPDTEEEDTYAWEVWNLKTDVVSMALCDFPLVFEYFVNKNIGVEAGIGATNVWSYVLYEEVLGMENSAYRYKGIWKPSFQAAVKYYPWRHRTTGFTSDMYFGLHGFARNYAYNIQDPEFPAMQGIRDTRQLHGWGFVWGFYTHSGAHFYSEYRLGIAYTTVRHTKHLYNESVPGSYIDQLKTYDKDLSLVVGIRIGFVK